MRQRAVLVIGVLACASLAASVPASAPAVETAVVVANGEARCYVYEGGAEPEFWIESNGVLTGGVPTPTGAGSGLQVTPGPYGADTRLSTGDWLEACVARLPWVALPDPVGSYVRQWIGCAVYSYSPTSCFW